MNCLYIFRGSGTSLPQFSNSSIWMYGKEYKPPDEQQQQQDVGEHSHHQASEDATESASNINNNNNNTSNNNNSSGIINSDTNNNNNVNDSVNNNNNSNSSNSSSSSSSNNNNHFVEEFLEDFSNKLWFSYRQGFDYIGDSLFENDCGWGCMLRSGQMLLSNVLLLNSIGKDWKKPQNGEYPEEFYKVVKLFLDKPSAPFSIHNIALHGQNHLGKSIGEWFAPSNISNAIRALVYKYDNLNGDDNDDVDDDENKKPNTTTNMSGNCNISVYVSDDGSLYIDQLLDIALKKDGTWIPLLILVPTKLGIDTINEIYYRPLLDIYTFPQSLGIVGGKPRASLYFIASQDDNLFYLDPHTVQNSIESDSDFNLSSYFCNIPKKANIAEVDPSLVIPFFCNTKESFLDFLERSKKLESSSEFPLYNIQEKAPNYQKDDISFDEEDDTSEEIDFESEYHML